MCPSDCSNNGFCYNATCHCNPGWKGGDCSIQTCPDECNYHGSCTSGKCVCRPGWSGDACETRTCPNECSGQGTCINFKCQCRFGFTGFDCASLACPRDCNGKGSCYNGQPPLPPTTTIFAKKRPEKHAHTERHTQHDGLPPGSPAQARATAHPAGEALIVRCALARTTARIMAIASMVPVIATLALWAPIAPGRCAQGRSSCRRRSARATARAAGT